MSPSKIRSDAQKSGYGSFYPADFQTSSSPVHICSYLSKRLEYSLHITGRKRFLLIMTEMCAVNSPIQNNLYPNINVSYRFAVYTATSGIVEEENPVAGLGI